MYALMVKAGDELTGVVTKAEIVNGGSGALRVISVDPHRAISDGVDTAGAGEVELRCTGYALEAWFDGEQPQAGDLVSLVLAELVDVGKDSPMKRFECALRRDPGRDPDDPGPSDADIPF